MQEALIGEFARKLRGYTHRHMERTLCEQVIHACGRAAGGGHHQQRLAAKRVDRVHIARSERLTKRNEAVG